MKKDGRKVDTDNALVCRGVGVEARAGGTTTLTSWRVLQQTRRARGVEERLSMPRRWRHPGNVGKIQAARLNP